MNSKKYLLITVSIVLAAALILAGCELNNHRSSGPSAPDAGALTNFYTSRGVGDGQIGGYVQDDEFVLNLPAGNWRVTYTMPDGAQHTKYVVLADESLCYFGTYGRVAQVEIEQGEFSADGANAARSQALFQNGLFNGWGVIIIVIWNGEVNTAGVGSSAGAPIVVIIPVAIVHPPLPEPPADDPGAGGDDPGAPTVPCKVTSSADDGSAGTLRQVLADALTDSCSTIAFDSSVGTITLSSTLEIGDAWTGAIDGSGGSGGKVAISGDNSVRVLSITDLSADVTLKNLTIKDGNSTYGGGVHNTGSLTLNSGASISGNTASESGGGVYVYMGASLTLNSGASISGNTTIKFGGGVYVSGGSASLTLNSGASISNNTAGNKGGGVFLNSGGNATLNGTIEGNQANGGTNNVGGGVFTWIDISGSIPDWGSGNVTSDVTTVENCYAGGSGTCP